MAAISEKAAKRLRLELQRSVLAQTSGTGSEGWLLPSSSSVAKIDGLA